MVGTVTVKKTLKSLGYPLAASSSKSKSKQKASTTSKKLVEPTSLKNRLHKKL